MLFQSTPTLDALPKAVTHNRWFASLTASQQAALVRASRMAVLRDGQVALSQGQTVRKRRDGLLLLVDGALKVSSTNATGYEAVLGFVYPGQWFGELSLLDGQPRARDVTSVGVSEVLVVEPEAFADLMKEASFARRMIELLCARNRLLLSLVEDFSMRTAYTRTARRLVLLAHEDDMRSGVLRKEVVLAHDSLASMLGMTRQTLANQLKALTEAGAIKQGYGRIHILSMSTLVAEAAAS